MITEYIRKQFEQHCNQQENKCWEWKGKKNDQGYGYLYGNKGPVSAHRVSYMIHKGEIKKGLHICHKCNKRCCVNPDHLYAGTDKENAEDRVLVNKIKKLKNLKREEKLLKEKITQVESEIEIYTNIKNTKEAR
jgi:hypothetical protein